MPLRILTIDEYAKAKQPTQDAADKLLREGQLVADLTDAQMLACRTALTVHISQVESYCGRNHGQNESSVITAKQACEQWVERAIEYRYNVTHPKVAKTLGSFVFVGTVNEGTTNTVIGTHLGDWPNGDPPQPTPSWQGPKAT
jgi:hypothetical protein